MADSKWLNIYSLALLTLGYIIGELAHFLIGEFGIFLLCFLFQYLKINVLKFFHKMLDRVTTSK